MDEHSRAKRGHAFLSLSLSLLNAENRREHCGPTIPITNISRGFSKLHLAEEGHRRRSLLRSVHFITPASARAPASRRKYFSFSSAYEHMRVDFLFFVSVPLFCSFSFPRVSPSAQSRSSGLVF